MVHLVNWFCSEFIHVYNSQPTLKITQMNVIYCPLNFHLRYFLINQITFTVFSVFFQIQSVYPQYCWNVNINLTIETWQQITAILDIMSNREYSSHFNLYYFCSNIELYLIYLMINSRISNNGWQNPVLW